MKILFVSDNFIPEVNAPANRTYEHCLRWVELGHKVTVITCVPNFPKGIVYSPYKNKFWQKEYINGIEIIRVWSFVSPNKGFILRLIDHLSFMITSLIASFFIKQFDVIITTTPQFFTTFTGYLVSVIRNKKWILEIRDLWPDSLIAVGILKKNLLFKFLKKLEYFFYRKASIIIVVTRSFCNIITKNKIPKTKVHIITNGVNRKHFRFIGKDENIINKLNLKGYFCIGYIGTIGMAHHIKTILDSAAYLNTLNYKIKFLIIGSGAEVENIKKEIKKNNIDNTIILDQIPHTEISKYWSILDCSITHLKKDNLFKSVIPSKIFESMSMGVPIIHGVHGESADLIRETNTGEIFKPQDTKELNSIIIKFYNDRKLLKMYKDNCIFTSEKFERNNLADKMLDIFLN